jgi:hypothetical protein
MYQLLCRMLPRPLLKIPLRITGSCTADQGMDGDGDGDGVLLLASSSSSHSISLM